MVPSVFMEQKFLTPHSLNFNKMQTKHAIHLLFCLQVEWVPLDHCTKFQAPVIGIWYVN